MSKSDPKSNPLRVGMISLGCAKNLVDAEIMLGALLADGVEITNEAGDADVVIVNTCSFIDSAQEESVDTILESAEVREARFRGQGLVVSGCLSQRFRDLLPELFPEVDGFMGIDQVAQVGTIVRQARERRSEKVRSPRPEPRNRRQKVARRISELEEGRTPDEQEKLREMAELFRTYADQYDFDWLMVAAQGYQESHLDQSKRSRVGAVGVMQVMPATAKDPAVGIPDIENVESNIHAGVRYLHLLRTTYLKDPALSDLDRTLLSFAAYNAGPGNLNKARKRAEKLGLNPNVWFDNVEISMGQAVSREPVIYVRNIFKYYTAFKLLAAERASRKPAE